MSKEINLEEERKAFEIMMKKHHPFFPINRSNNKNGEYVSAGTTHMWRGWLLCMRSLQS